MRSFSVYLAVCLALMSSSAATRETKPGPASALGLALSQQQSDPSLHLRGHERAHPHRRMPSPALTRPGRGLSTTAVHDVRELSSKAQRQIAQYKKGEGLIVNIHITHHAGTTLCNWAKAYGPAPKFGE